MDEDAVKRVIDIKNAIYDGDVSKFIALTKDDNELRNGKNTWGSFLHIACDEGQLGIVQYLVENGADVNLCGGASDAGPMLSALSENHFDIAKYLYSQGARPETATAGVNPVFRAITNGNTQTAEWLVQIGFNLHLTYRTASGKLRNALVYAKERGATEITELLLKEGCKLPVEGVDIPVNEAEVKSVEPTAADRIRAEIVSFLGQQFGHVEELALQEILPVLDDVSVAIKVIRPNEQRHVMTLFTTGVSDQPLTVPAGKEAYQFAELVMHLPATWPHPKDALSDEEALWPFQCLRKTAYKPHITESWLGAPASIISFDEPLDPNVKHTCLLLLADRIPPLDSKEGKQIRFYTVVPLYAEERDFATQHGLDVLVERLTDRGLLVFDPEREIVGVQ